MSRSERLLALLQHLRRHRATLAADLGISLRTLYRDIATLQAQGAHLDGALGLGFVLPPLMFSADEVEALVLGSRWAFSTGCRWWWRGASCAGRSGISAPTASRH